MKTIHYLSHTHWDREWLRSSDASRIKLVYLFDQLIEIMEQDKTYTYFTFDGQTAAIEDYLSIKPFQKDKIVKLVSEKRLFIGPWYTQPDMFLAAGESLIRNLLIGSRYAEDLGHCMNVGWIPDAFGQIEKTPQLFRAFHMQAIFVWRGFDYDKLKDSLFWWDSPQNDSILTVHFPLGYGYYRYLPRGKKEAWKDIAHHVKACEERFQEEEILFMGGSDYAHPQKELPMIINEIQDMAKKEGYKLKLSNPEEYIQDVKQTLNKNKRRLQHYFGEARSTTLCRIHAGISSTRIDIKNEMKLNELRLAQIIEPMSVITHMMGGTFSQDILNYYWKILFKNQFHDSAYSSSPDTINQTVKNRLLNLRHGLQELIWMNFRFLQKTLDLSSLSVNEDLLVLFNTLPYKRKGLAFVNMIVEQEQFVLKNEKKQQIPFVRLHHVYPVNNEIEYYNGIANFHDSGEILEGTKKQVQILIDTSLLPPMGYQAFKISYNKTPIRQVCGDVRRIDTYTFENSYLRVYIQENGSLQIFDKEQGLTYDKIHYFEEKGDDGDEYNYSPPIKEKIQTTLTARPTITCIEEHPCLITFQITYLMDTPSACVHHERINDHCNTTIITNISLCKEAHRIDFDTTIINGAKDHIIRVAFQDLHQAEYNISQDHFGITRRSNRILEQHGSEKTEVELPMYPMQRFVKLDHDKGVFALLSKGPCEYEVCDDQILLLTLLRCVGKFGKADLQVRPGRSSGYRLDTPSSQLLTTIKCSYSLFIKNVSSLQELARETNMVNTEVVSRYLNQLHRSTNEGMPWSVNNLQLPVGLELMAFKKSEDGRNLILRLLNTNKFLFHGASIQISSCITQCFMSDVKEATYESLPIQNGVLKIPDMEGQSFITLKLKIQK